MKTNNNQEDFRKPIPLGCAYSNPNNVFLNGHACVYDVRGIAPTLVTATGGAISHLSLKGISKNEK